MKKTRHQADPSTLEEVKPAQPKKKTSRQTSTKSRKRTKAKKHQPGEALVAPVLLIITIIISYLIFVLT